MRTLLLLAITCAAGCDQLSTPDAVPPASVQWVTAHDGVELASAGRVSLVPDRGSPIDVLHVRVRVAGALSGDASSATLELLGTPPIHPIAVNAQLSTLPIALLDAGRAETLDLFFRLPDDRAGVRGVFSWTVSTPRTTRLLRAQIPLDSNEAPVLSGSRWWFASSYAWPTFRHQDGIITAESPVSASIAPLDDDSIPNPCDEW